MNPSKRMRGKALQKQRAEYFRMNPLCKRCGVAAAKELDHIRSLHKGGSDELWNKQGLCIACHKVKTLEDFGHKTKERIGTDGYPIDEQSIG